MITGQSITQLRSKNLIIDGEESFKYLFDFVLEDQYLYATLEIHIPVSLILLQKISICMRY